MKYGEMRKCNTYTETKLIKINCSATQWQLTVCRAQMRDGHDMHILYDKQYW